jgi:hypothetical protein
MESFATSSTTSFLSFGLKTIVENATTLGLM